MAWNLKTHTSSLLQTKWKEANREQQLLRAEYKRLQEEKALEEQRSRCKLDRLRIEQELDRQLKHEESERLQKEMEQWLSKKQKQLLDERAVRFTNVEPSTFKDVVEYMIGNELPPCMISPLWKVVYDYVSPEYSFDPITNREIGSHLHGIKYGVYDYYNRCGMFYSNSCWTDGNPGICNHKMLKCVNLMAQVIHMKPQEALSYAIIYRFKKMLFSSLQELLGYRP